MRVEVDRGLCVGSGWCVNIAAPAFEIGESGKAVHVSGTAVTEDQLLEAAENCPVAAIEVGPGTEDTRA